MLETSKPKQTMVTFYQLELFFRIASSSRGVIQKVHLLDRIDRNDALENSLCLTYSIGKKIITKRIYKFQLGKYIVKLAIIKVYT